MATVLRRLEFRLGASVLHALLNTVLVMATGKYFYSAWERMGRPQILDSGEALVPVAIIVASGTFVFWVVPPLRDPSPRRRLAGAALITVASIIAGAAGSFVLGTYRAG